MLQLTREDRLFFEFTERCQISCFSAPEVLSAILAIVPGEVARYLEMRPRKNESRNWVEPADVAGHKLDEEVWPKLMGQHRGLQDTIATCDGRTRMISQFWSQAEFYNGALYSEYYKLQGIKDTIFWSVDVSPDLVIAIGVGRGKWGFSHHEMFLMNRLYEYFKLGWHIVKSEKEQNPLSISFICEMPDQWLVKIRNASSVVDMFGLERVTPCELKVLAWMAQGKTNSEIAVILSNSVTTIKTHADRVFEKLGVNNRHAAAVRLRDVILKVENCMTDDIVLT